MKNSKTYSFRCKRYKFMVSYITISRNKLHNIVENRFCHLMYFRIASTTGTTQAVKKNNLVILVHMELNFSGIVKYAFTKNIRVGVSLKLQTPS